MTPEEFTAHIRGIYRRLLEALRPIFERLAELARRVVSIWHWYQAATAQTRWKHVQQQARFFTRHPDLAALDRMLDRFYPDPVLA